MVDHEIEIQAIDTEKKQVVFRTVGRLSGFKLKDNVAQYCKRVEKKLQKALEDDKTVVAHWNEYGKISKIHKLCEKTTEVHDWNIKDYVHVGRRRKKPLPEEKLLPKEARETIKKALKKR